ncbi:hypothetical protein NKH92_23360 [Mesorhizobium sp. M0871]|uniref:hypothetical protein n=1 Tax=Mesorhizobium sp. M0871 TaxID=2957017 RepID=UPI00333DB8F6
MEVGSFLDEDETAIRTRMRDYGLDTVFGLWLPRTYAAEVETSIRDQRRSLGNRLSVIGAKLSDPKVKQNAMEGFQNYVSSMDRYLGELDIKPKPIKDRDGSFARFLAVRTRNLTNAGYVERHSRLVTFAPMFDAWLEPRVANEFERSFFEELAWRAQALRRAKIVRTLLDGIDVDDGWTEDGDLPRALSAKLKRSGWEDEEWEA